MSLSKLNIGIFPMDSHSISSKFTKTTEEIHQSRPYSQEISPAPFVAAAPPRVPLHGAPPRTRGNVKGGFLVAKKMWKICDKKNISAGKIGFEPSKLWITTSNIVISFNRQERDLLVQKLGLKRWAAREGESAGRNYVFQKPKKSGFAQHSVAFKSCKQFKIVGWTPE